MALDEETLEARRLFMPIAIMEHHQTFNPNLSPYDICERLGALWKQVQKEAGSKVYNLEADGILKLNTRIASALNGEPADFLDREGWLDFLQGLKDIGSLEEDDGHVYNWIFAQLYWHHLNRFRLSTSWILINALHLQHGRTLNRLSLEKLGNFLDSLSGAGPPIYDGQTFFAQTYS